MSKYIALKTLKMNDRDCSIRPGQSVDVSSWTPRVIRAHVNRNFIEKVTSEETVQTFKTPTRRVGRPKKIV